MYTGFCLLWRRICTDRRKWRTAGEIVGGYKIGSDDNPYDVSLSFGVKEETDIYGVTTVYDTLILIWDIRNVNGQDDLKPIYYSTGIGVYGGDTDVNIGKTDLLNRVYIYSNYDHKDVSIENRNYAEEGISVVKGRASSYGKYAINEAVDVDGEAGYIVYANNNANTKTDISVMDVMPKSGLNGSDYYGEYDIVLWNVNPLLCDTSKINIYYTTDEFYENLMLSDIDSAVIDEMKVGKFNSGEWKKLNITPNGDIEIPDEHIVAWIMAGKLYENRIAEVKMILDLHDN